jgi:hypothetical protein
MAPKTVGGSAADCGGISKVSLHYWAIFRSWLGAVSSTVREYSADPQYRPSMPYVAAKRDRPKAVGFRAAVRCSRY